MKIATVPPIILGFVLGPVPPQSTIEPSVRLGYVYIVVETFRVVVKNTAQANANRTFNVNKKIQSGKACLVSLKRHLIETDNSCKICGINDWQDKPIVLIIDHINGDHSNNNLSNLRLVCPNCDSQLPTFKNRNKGNGRHSRRERYAKGQSY